jgi:hypothetical protein
MVVIMQAATPTSPNTLQMQQREAHISLCQADDLAQRDNILYRRLAIRPTARQCASNPPRARRREQDLQGDVPKKGAMLLARLPRFRISPEELDPGLRGCGRLHNGASNDKATLVCAAAGWQEPGKLSLGNFGIPPRVTGMSRPAPPLAHTPPTR